MTEPGATAPKPTDRWSERLEAATTEFDWTELEQITSDYVRHLRSASEVVPQSEASRMLGLLRGVRRYPQVLEVADALLGHGLNDAFVKRQFAQALVERGNPGAARLLYQGIIDDETTPAGERIEALGGIGRCCKQLYLTDQVDDRRRKHLPAAVAAYEAAYLEDHDNYWHGINLVALLARAARDGVQIPGVKDPATKSRKFAKRVLRHVVEPDVPDVWQLATACEAAVALGDLDVALGRANRLIAHPDVDAFSIASLLRQLIEVWQLNTDDPPGEILVPLLRSGVLCRDGGAVTVDVHDTRAGRSEEVMGYESADGRNLEAVLGPERYKGLTWWLTGLERCRAVARIESAFQDAIGTGFLIRGTDLSSDLPDIVLVTNGHVVPEKLTYGRAFAVFHGLEVDSPLAARKHEIVTSWWYESSTSPNLDVTILELDSYPDDVTPIPIATEMPNLEGKVPPRAYVIGHPSGWDTPQFSLQDNLLLDYDATLVHYRSPTEHGSSGSPVFDASWSLIAVHHAGGLETPQLHSKGGTYPANEGISVDAIRSKLLQSPPRGVAVIRQR